MADGSTRLYGEAMTSWTPGWGSFPAPLLDFWTERHLCTLTTLRPDGRPHVVPVGVALDHEQECAWVITSGSSRKVRNLLAAGSDGSPVAACAVDGARWSTLEGVATVLHDPASVARACERYAARYRVPRDNPARVAIRISASRFTGSASLLEPATGG
jgi:PPOX class probable F420-dependent enzyme